MKTYDLQLILPNIEKQIRIQLYQKVKNKVRNENL